MIFKIYRGTYQITCGMKFFESFWIDTRSEIFSKCEEWREFCNFVPQLFGFFMSVHPSRLIFIFKLIELVNNQLERQHKQVDIVWCVVKLMMMILSVVAHTNGMHIK